MARTEPPARGVGDLLERLASLEARHRDRTFDELRAAVLAGRGDAWRLLVEKYSRFVYAVALRLAEGPEDREETVAAIYARVFDRLAARQFACLRGFQGRCRFTTYLFRMVQTERKDYLARRRTRTRAETAGEAEAEAEAIPPPIPVLDAESIRRAAGDAVRRLEPADRLLLLHRFRDGLKLREIAAIGPYRDVNAVAHALGRALSRMDLLRRLREQARLGDGEIDALGEALRRELLDADEAMEVHL